MKVTGVPVSTFFLSFFLEDPETPESVKDFLLSMLRDSTYLCSLLLFSVLIATPRSSHGSKPQHSSNPPTQSRSRAGREDRT